MGVNGAWRLKVYSSGGHLSGGSKAYEWAAGWFEPSNLTNGNPFLGRTVTARRWDTVYAINGTINTSDARLKHDIEDAPLGLSFINRLRPVQFKWNAQVNNGTPGTRFHNGFIAQEVKQALLDEGYDPNLFAAYQMTGLDGEDGDEDFSSLNYGEFISIVVNAIQELYADKAQLQSDHDTLRSDHDALRADYVALDARLALLEGTAA